MFILALLVALASADADETRQCIINCARNQLGKPYVWGANGPDSFDCSGLVYYCYEQCGYYFDHRAWTGTLMYMGIEVYESNLIMADLVFPFEGHVQMYTSGGYIIHSPRPNDYVTEEPLSTFWLGRRLILGGDETPDGGDGTAPSTGGTVTFLYAVNVRASASTSSEVVAQYNAGDVLVYDSIVVNSECSWMSYVGGSGNRRYVCGKNPSGTCYVRPCP